MAWAIGLSALVAWVVMWLLEARWSALPAYDRPRLTHSAAYPLWAGIVRKLLLAVSLLALAIAHRAAFVGAVLLLLAGWGVRRVRASAGIQRRLMQREFDRLRREKPQAPDTEILFQIILSRHERWGPELVQQIVQENPSVERAARVVARMETQLKG
jgi:hypothetical protein